MWSFNGTAESLVSHVCAEQPGERCDAVLTKNTPHKITVDTLSDDCTIVAPAALHNKSPLVPLNAGDYLTLTCVGETYNLALEEEELAASNGCKELLHCGCKKPVQGDVL